MLGKSKSSKVFDHSDVVDRSKTLAQSFLAELAAESYERWRTSLGERLAVSTANSQYDKYVSENIQLNEYSMDSTGKNAFASDYQVMSLLRKADFISTGIDRRANAVNKWCDAERQCAKSNFNLEYATLVGDEALLAILQRMRDFLKRVLGPAPKVANLDCRFGPGATALVKRDIVLPKKYGKTVCCTPSLLQLVMDSRCNLLGHHWNPNELLVVDGNTLSFVPKDAKTDRAIAIEPDLNIFVQLGIGTAIRSRFMRYFDLRTQADVNRRLVAQAYDLGLATIDLSSASDTVSSHLVSLIIPDDWYDLMDQARSRHTLVKIGETDQALECEKFSSMGNGFTFELETIIFYSLGRAIGCDENFSVFGDDIILPAHKADEMIHWLMRLGFKTNEEKTFRNGAFFESCGHDYYMGQAVRPIFWKRCDHIQHVVKMCNDVSRMSHNPELHVRVGALHKKYHDEFRKILRRVGQLQLVPQGLGDVGIIADFDEVTPRVRNGSASCKVLAFRTESADYSRKRNGYISALNQPTSQDVVVNGRPSPSALFPVRGRGKWVVRQTTYPTWAWSGFGPWVV